MPASRILLLPRTTLSDRRRGGQERGRDLFGLEPAYFTQREGNLRGRGQGRVAAREDQPQPVVFDVFVIGRRRRGDFLDPAGDLVHRCVKPRAAADGIDGFEPARGDEPRTGIGRHTVARPLFGGRCKRVVQGLLRQVEVP
jgi:hypothetical protein